MTRIRTISRRRGFTLVEAAMVTVIVGVGTVATLQLMAAGTIANSDGAEATAAVDLARNIRELCLSLSFSDPTTPSHWGLENGESFSAGTYDDLDDLDGAVFDPPINSQRQSLTAMAGWQQQVAVHSVDPNCLTLQASNGSSDCVQVTVTIIHHGRSVANLSWYAFKAHH